MIHVALLYYLFYTTSMRKIVFIGQAPARPGSKHEVAGTYLHAWLRRIGFSDEQITRHCVFLALIDNFPGMNGRSHAVPSPRAIAAYRPVLLAKLQEIQPDILVPVGKLAIAEIMNTTDAKLTEVIGKQFTSNTFDVLQKDVSIIPLPHPSGRSTWTNQHPELVNRALHIIKDAAQG